jgi:hypothetical protein
MSLDASVYLFFGRKKLHASPINENDLVETFTAGDDDEAGKKFEKMAFP